MLALLHLPNRGNLYDSRGDTIVRTPQRDWIFVIGIALALVSVIYAAMILKAAIGTN
jgi:hypothetical protein